MEGQEPQEPQEPPQPMIPRIRILFGGMNPLNIMEQSFQEEKIKDTPASTEFKESLLEEEIQDEELSCAICQEPFQKGELVIKLPCEGQKHYFHKGDDPEKCQGIKPWLEVNNKCPICRTEFPMEEQQEEDESNSEDNGDNNGGEDNGDNNGESNSDDEEYQGGFVLDIPLGDNNINQQMQPIFEELMENMMEQMYEADLQRVLMESFEET